MLTRIRAFPPFLQCALFRNCIKSPLIAIIRGFSKANRRQRFDKPDEDSKALRTFLQRMTPGIIPRGLCKVSFSKSSGPGGQNVNKLNTKATVRLNVHEVEDKLGWPVLLVDAMAAHRKTTNDGDLIVSSGRYRTQTQNLEDAYEKLYEFIKNLVKLPGLTSLDAAERIEKLKRKDKEKVRQWKTERSDKKQDRRGGSRTRDFQDDYGW